MGGMGELCAEEQYLAVGICFGNALPVLACYLLDSRRKKTAIDGHVLFKVEQE